MTTPGFTAFAALPTVRSHYPSVASGGEARGVVPQAFFGGASGGLGAIDIEPEQCVLRCKWRCSRYGCWPTDCYWSCF